VFAAVDGSDETAVEPPGKDVMGWFLMETSCSPAIALTASARREVQDGPGALTLEA
jgi:hypothetical protein